MTTPLPVPTQRRLPAMSRAVMRTKEKPSLPVPGGRGESRQAQRCLRALPAPLGQSNSFTQHLADVGLDVHVLQVLVGVGVIQPQCGVQADGHPYPVADPCQLPHLALPPRVGIKGLLRVTAAHQ